MMDHDDLNLNFGADEEEDLMSFPDMIESLTSLAGKRDPRHIRLSSVTSALVDVLEGDITPAKVYASCVSTLEGTLKQDLSYRADDSLATQVALLELFSVTVPHVAQPTLGATITVTSRVLRGVISSCQAVSSEASSFETKDELGGIPSVLKAACRASTEFLRSIPSAVPEKAVRQLLYGTLLSMFQDPRQGIQKAAQGGVCELLVVEECHPSIKKGVNSFVHSHLESLRKDPLNEEKNKDLLYLLGFLQQSILHLQTMKLGGDMMELLMKLLQFDSATLTDSSSYVTMTRKDATTKVLTINAILSTILAVLVDADEIRDESEKNTLDEYAKRVLASLLQARPSLVFREGAVDDELIEGGRIVYGQVVLTCCQRTLNSNDKMTGCKLLPLAVQLLLNLSKPSEESPDGGISEVLMMELLQLYRVNLAPLKLLKISMHQSCVENCLRAMEPIFGVGFQETWATSLQAFVVLLQQMNDENELVQTLFLSLLDIHSKYSESDHSRLAIEGAVASLVQSVGVETIWRRIEWSGGSSEEGIRKDIHWILPIMKASGTTNEGSRPHLRFFQQEVLPLARLCDGMRIKDPKNGNHHRNCVLAIWSLLPSFCQDPEDMASALPDLVPLLTRAMNDQRYPELVTIICNGLVGLASCVAGKKAELEELIENHYEDSRKDSEALEKASSKLLPVLFKFIDSLHSASKSHDAMDEDVELAENDFDQNQLHTQSEAASQAIASLAQGAPKTLVTAMFKKVIQRLLEASQSEEDQSGKMVALLSLSQALVASETLDEPSISLLYRSLKPLIRTDQVIPRVQKRAYKVMAEIIRRYKAFVVGDEARLKEMCELLTASIMTSQISSRYMRLKCLSSIVESFQSSNALHMKTVAGLIGEVILCLKDSNAKTREAAYQLLLSMARVQDNAQQTLQLVMAGLGAETSQMRSAAVMAVSRLVFEFSRDDPSVQAILPALFQTLLVLFDDPSREVIKSVVGFVRVCVVAMPREQLQPLLPEIVGGLLRYHRGKDRFREKIKIILKKLVKMFGYEELMPLVPTDNTRLLTHMRKLDEREARRKARRRGQIRDEKAKSFDEMVESDEEDSDDGRTLMTGATGFSRLTSRTGKSFGGRSGKTTRLDSETLAGYTTAAGSRKSRRSAAAGMNPKLQLRNDIDGNVTELGTLNAKSVRFADANDSDRDADGDDIALEFDGSGKLIVRDDFDEVGETGHGEDDDYESDMIQNRSKKRKMASKLEMTKQSAKSQAADRKANSNNKKRSKANQLGSAYKSKKAGGDVKRKDQKYEPYAFVPLDGKNYSKKNRRQAVEQMGSIVPRGKKRQRR